MDCALGGVAAMHVQRDKLESYLVFFESFAEFFTTLVFKDMKFRGVAICLDLEKNCFPTGRELCCLAVLDWVWED